MRKFHGRANWPTLVSAVLGMAILGAAAVTNSIDAWPMWGGTPDRNMVNMEASSLPATWDIETGKNVKWVATLGSQSYGNPVVARGKVFVGTNNESVKNPKIRGDKGVVMCFDQATGKFLWQAVHDKLPTGRVNDWPEQGVCSSPVVDGDRLYYVSNRCEVVCLDTEGFYDGENDGPIQDERYQEKIDADFVWTFNMMDELGVFPHNMSNCSPLLVGDYLYVITSNGVDEGHINIPSPFAPSFICLNKNTGELVWEDASPGDRIYHGQWSSPSYGVVNGKPQVYFAGGDGWLYAFAPEGDPDNPGASKLIWKFNCNPAEARWILGGRGTANNIIATPVFYNNRVYIGVGQDPEHLDGEGHLWCIDATKTGDVSPFIGEWDERERIWRSKGDNPSSAMVWHYGYKNFGRTIATVAVADGLVYAAELAGYLHCLDAETGELYWKHDLLSAVWGSPYVADGKVYIGDEDGEVTVFAHSKEKQVLGEMYMGDSVYSTPVAVGKTLFIMTRSRLYCIEQE